MDIIDAMTGRGCRRAFLDKPVSPETIQTILDAARWAPSAVNSQPWQVAVVSGETKQQISNSIIQARQAGIKPHADYEYYPTQWFEPYKSRRFACGMALYGALDIKRDDAERRQAVWDANYMFFGAPVGLMFFIHKNLEKGSWMDIGMFLQNVMLAARHHGLETCPQAALAEYPDLVRQILPGYEDMLVVCGMAVGYADFSQAINQFRTTREPVESFTKWFE